MRSILLASAALIMTTGIACAQTGPAPTGSTTAPTESPAGSAASPGNMGTGNNAAGVTPGTGAAMGTPAPTGAAQAAQESPNPSAPPGNMAPGGSAPATNSAAGNSAAANPAPATAATSTTAPSTTAMNKPVHHHNYGGMTMPENASADRYLHIASDAIKHHNKSEADDALSHAETRMLTRSVPASSDMTDDSPRISAIENARKALSSGDFQTAADDTRQAMHGHMGGMGHMGAMNGPDSTSDQPMPGSPMSNAAATGTSASGK